LNGPLSSPSLKPVSITLAQARDIFKDEYSNQDEIDKEIIVYQKNKHAFMKLMGCIEIKDGNISINVQKFRANESHHEPISLNDSQITEEKDESF